MQTTPTRRRRLPQSTSNQQATVSRSVQRRRKGQIEESSEITERVEMNRDPELEQCPNPAYVEVKGGVTRSMGEGTFEFVRVDVGVSFPCLPTTGALDEAFEFARGKVDEYMKAELEGLDAPR